MSDLRFSIEVQGFYDFTVDDLWPDGNAPENPTVADVVALVKAEGSLSQLRCKWYMDDDEVTVVDLRVGGDQSARVEW